MSTLFKFVLFIALVGSSFGGGYWAGTSGYRVTDPNGVSLIKSNAAQLVKDENAKLQRDVIGKSESEAESLLSKGNRTLFVALRDGKEVARTTQKTFTNLSVEVKDGKVVKALGWY